MKAITPNGGRAPEAEDGVAALYRRAIAAAGAVVYRENYAADSYEFVGEGITNLTGYQASEFTRQQWVSMITDYEIPGPGGFTTREEARRLMRSGAASVWQADFKIRTRNGEEKWVSDASVNVLGPDGEPVGSIGILMDVTERRRNRERADAERRLESIGRLAGGIAHDFNNLLTTIIGYSDLIAHEYGRFESLAFNIGEISHAAQRAAALTSQLLAFGQRQMLILTDVDLSSVVASNRARVQNALGEEVKLITHLCDKVDWVRADEAQLEQLLVHLAEHARATIRGEGAVLIETGNVYLDEGYRRLHPELVPGCYVQLLFNDNGDGSVMDGETARRLFEPFFTTRELGGGSGLGLATVYGIVKQLGGHIWVYSEPGAGTTFKLLFPRTEPRVPSLSPDGSGHFARKREATIMVVDNEPSILKLVADGMRADGHTVLESRSGEEAIRMLSRLKYPPLDLLITDVIMPGMAGQKLAHHLSNKYQDLSVLYISGHMRRAVDPNEERSGAQSFLQKPFSPSSVRAKVRSMLGPAENDR